MRFTLSSLLRDLVVQNDILTRVVDTARRSGARLPFATNTAYVNTIPPDEEPSHPGDRESSTVFVLGHSRSM